MLDRLCSAPPACGPHPVTLFHPRTPQDSVSSGHELKPFLVRIYSWSYFVSLRLSIVLFHRDRLPGKRSVLSLWLGAEAIPAEGVQPWEGGQREDLGWGSRVCRGGGECGRQAPQRVGACRSSSSKAAGRRLAGRCRARAGHSRGDTPSLWLEECALGASHPSLDRGLFGKRAA